MQEISERIFDHGPDFSMVVDATYYPSNSSIPGTKRGAIKKPSRGSRARGRNQATRLHGDARNRFAPVGVTGVGHSTSLKNVGRAGSQTGDEDRRLAAGKNFARP